MRKQLFNILMIEDSLDHAELIRRSFQEYHFPHHLIHLEDGEAAINYLFKMKNQPNVDGFLLPDLILLDLRLPKIDGIDVLKEIRRNPDYNFTPVVILTTSNQSSDIEQAYQHHANSYLVKPLEYDNFTRLMKDLGLYWLNWNQYPLRFYPHNP